MQSDQQFLQKNYRYFQEWYRWCDKAKRLRAQARALYADALPDLRRFEKALKVAHRELDKRSSKINTSDVEVVPIKATEPDIMAAVFLFGTALENVFKGLMVSKDRSLIGANKLSGKLISNNLVQLARDAGIDLLPKEQDLLDWVSKVVIWRGRYPVPTNTQHVFFTRLTIR